MKEQRKKRGLAGLFVCILILALTLTGAVSAADNRVADTLYSALSKGSGFSRIRIIGIDEADLEQYGNPAGWSRSMWASVLDALSDPENAPAVVGIDLLLDGEKDPEGDQALVETVRNLRETHGTGVVAGSRLDLKSVLDYRTVNGSTVVSREMERKVWSSYPTLREVTESGYMNAFKDTDGIVRRSLLKWKDPSSGEELVSFDYAVAEAYLEHPGDRNPAGDPEEKTGGEADWYIQYSGSQGESDLYYQMYSVHELLAGETDEGEVLTPEVFRDRIVLIGAWASGMQDEVQTTVSRQENMFGITVHANIVDDLLDPDTEKKSVIGDGVQRLLLLVLLLAGLVVGSVFSVGWSAVFWAVTAGGWLLTCLAMYEGGRILHPLWISGGISLLFVYEIYSYGICTGLERLLLRNRFAQYMDRALVDRVLKQGEDALSPAGKERQIAVLFVDICGFTSLSEEIGDPEAVVLLLNRYLELVTGCMESHGILDKYIGDAAMMFWCQARPGEEDLLADPKYLEHAAETALRMKERMAELGPMLREYVEKYLPAETDIEENLSRLGFAVGIHCGPAVVGNIGCSRRMDYTAIGETVNLASRLESLKIPGRTRAGEIYVSENVMRELQGRDFSFEDLGCHPIKGLREEQRIYAMERGESTGDRGKSPLTE